MDFNVKFDNSNVIRIEKNGKTVTIRHNYINGTEYQNFKIVERDCKSSHIFAEDDGTLTFHEHLTKPDGIGTPIILELFDDGLKVASSDEKSQIILSLEFLKYYCKYRLFLTNGWWFEVFKPITTDSYRMLKLNENNEPIFLIKDFEGEIQPPVKKSKNKKELHDALNKQLDIQFISEELNKCKNSPYYFFTRYVNSSFWYAKTAPNLIDLSEEEFNKLFL